MPFQIKYGDITKSKADAVVCSIALESYHYGEIWRSIGRAAKSGELDDKIINGKYNVGDMFLSQGYNLPAKNIVFSVLPFKRDDEDLSKLRNVYRSVLEDAIGRGDKSIAFPLLGTGNNGYEREESYNLICEEVKQITDREESTGVEIITVYLILYSKPKKHIKPSDTEKYEYVGFKSICIENKLCAPKLIKKLNSEYCSFNNLRYNNEIRFDILKCIPEICKTENRQERMSELIRVISSLGQVDISYINKGYYNLGDYFFNICSKHGVSLDDICKKSGMSKQEKSRYVVNSTHVSKVYLYKIAFMFNMDIDEVLTFHILNGTMFSPFDELDIFYLRYLAGEFGKIKSLFDLSLRAEENGIRELLVWNASK